MKFFLGRKSTSFRTQRIVAKDVDLRPSAPKVLTMSFQIAKEHLLPPLITVDILLQLKAKLQSSFSIKGNFEAAVT